MKLKFTYLYEKKNHEFKLIKFRNRLNEWNSQCIMNKMAKIKRKLLNESFIKKFEFHFLYSKRKKALFISVMNMKWIDILEIQFKINTEFQSKGNFVYYFCYCDIITNFAFPK